jgi:hypothetical protein
MTVRFRNFDTFCIYVWISEFPLYFFYLFYVRRRLRCGNDIIDFTYTVFVDKPVGEHPPGRPRRKRQCSVKKGVTKTLWRSQAGGTFRRWFQWPNFVKISLDRPARHVVMSLISDICCGPRLISLLVLPVSDDFVTIQIHWDVMMCRCASSSATCVAYQTTDIQEHSCEDFKMSRSVLR